MLDIPTLQRVFAEKKKNFKRLKHSTIFYFANAKWQAVMVKQIDAVRSFQVSFD